jgi:hypothetical protein
MLLAAVLGTIVPKVTGGVLTSDSTYYYRTFTSNGTLTVRNVNLVADLLVIAGGGGSGDNGGGGGGGGGVFLQPSQLIGGTNATYNYTVTVGAGGAMYTNGSNSSIGFPWTAIGGG